MARHGKTHFFTTTAIASAAMMTAGLVSKPFRVAFAGQTVDGRVIEEQWIKDIVETYNTELYTAQIFPEHWRGLTPGGDFSSQGDVISAHSQVDTVDGETALALYLTIAPNASLIEMNRRGEKKYTSIEVTENFRGTGKAYLTGLAVTDSPASVATEALKFSATQLHKQITDSIETSIEFINQQAEKQPGMFSKAFQSFKDKLAAFNTKNDTQLTDLVQGMGEMVDKFAVAQKQSDEAYRKLAQQVQKLEQQYASQGDDVGYLKKQYAVMDSTDANPVQRPAATGGFANQYETNC